MTASPRNFLEPCVKRLGWEHLFDDMWSVDEFGKTKGEPALFTAVAERLGVRAEDCCMIDDSVHALHSAKAAGWQTVGIYEELSNSEHLDEMRSVSDMFVYDLKEIL